MSANTASLIGPAGVVFTTEPTPAGPITLAVFADTCGNLIQMYQRA